MSATARAATARPSRRPARPPVRRRPVLTEVPPAAAAVAGSGVFALVVVSLLVAGMGVLLVLNTTLAQGAFQISALTRTQNQLAVQEQQLLQQVAQEESPESLQQRATALGMVPVPAPVFLRLADGAVLGTPEPAVAITRSQRLATLADTGGLGWTSTSAAAPAPSAAGSFTGSTAAVADPAPQGDAAVADPQAATTSTAKAPTTKASTTRVTTARARTTTRAATKTTTTTGTGR